MATKKTLNQILRQGSFSGADAGKAKILNWVAFMTTGKKPLDDSEINQIVNSIISSKQYEIYKAYDQLASYLNDFANMAGGNLQQYYRAKVVITNNILQVSQQQQAYDTYLHLPLVLTEKEYSKLKAEAVKEYEARRDVLFSTLLDKTAEYIDLYDDDKAIPSEIKAVLDSYKTQSLKIDVASRYLPPQESSEAEREAENLQTLKNFAEKYGIDNTQDAINKFISSSVVGYIEGSLFPEDKTKARGLTRLLSKIEVYEGLNKAECAFRGEPYKDIFPQAPTEPDYQEINKLEALEAVSYDNFYYYTDKHSQQYYKAFIKDFPELYKAVKKELGASLKNFETLDDRTLATRLISNRELQDAGLLAPLKKSDVINLICEYIGNSEALKVEDFIRRQKAIFGGLAIQLEKGITPKDDPNLIEAYSTLPTNYFLQRNNDPQETERTIEEVLKPALCAIYGLEALFDVYGDLFKVDLSPLKVSSNIAEDITRYNALIYSVYSRIYGTEKQIKADQKAFKKIFRTINLDDYKPKPELIEEMRAELEGLPLKKTVTLNYFSKFLKGAGVRYE